VYPYKLSPIWENGLYYFLISILAERYILYFLSFLSWHKKETKKVKASKKWLKITSQA
jgi:hypothetical protein